MPFVLGKRVLIFFAQLLPYSLPQAPPETSKLPRLGDDAGKLLRFQTWEIQLGWSELKNGKWSSKQLIMGSVMIYGNGISSGWYRCQLCPSGCV
jgi:hypothetical protein